MDYHEVAKSDVHFVEKFIHNMFFLKDYRTLVCIIYFHLKLVQLYEKILTHIFNVKKLERCNSV